MTTPCAPTTQAAAPSEPDAFLDLVCGDEELLRAEFEDIVAAEWPAPPSCRAVVHGQHGGNGGPAPGAPGTHAIDQPTDPEVTVDDSCRQRSPPAHPVARE